MRSEAQKRADKKYNAKSGLFSLMYRPKEILEAEKLAEDYRRSKKTKRLIHINQKE